MPICKIKVPCSTTYLQRVRQSLQTILGASNMDDQQRYLYILAVEEICSNIMIHSRKNNPHDFLELSVSTSDKGIGLEIIDEGTSFDMNCYQAPDMGQVVKERRRGSMGIILVRKISEEVMDDFTFEKTSQGMVYRFFKKCQLATR